VTGPFVRSADRAPWGARRAAAAAALAALSVVACGQAPESGGSADAGSTGVTAVRSSPSDGARGAAAAPAEPATSGRSALERIVAQCTEDMVRQTCRVMGNAAGASVPADTVIFVAGIGAIDAAIYNRLRADGQAMCETVRRSCTEAWDGPACKTARALYGGA
jgi:hypothetical protein